MKPTLKPTTPNQGSENINSHDKCLITTPPPTENSPSPSIVHMHVHVHCICGFLWLICSPWLHTPGQSLCVHTFYRWSKYRSQECPPWSHSHLEWLWSGLGGANPSVCVSEWVCVCVCVCVCVWNNCTTKTSICNIICTQHVQNVHVVIPLNKAPPPNLTHCTDRLHARLSTCAQCTCTSFLPALNIHSHTPFPLFSPNLLMDAQWHTPSLIHLITLHPLTTLTLPPISRPLLITLTDTYIYMYMCTPSLTP